MFSHINFTNIIVLDMKWKNKLQTIPDVPLYNHNLHIFQLWYCSSLFKKNLLWPLNTILSGNSCFKISKYSTVGN